MTRPEPNKKFESTEDCAEYLIDLLTQDLEEALDKVKEIEENLKIIIEKTRENN